MKNIYRSLAAFQHEVPIIHKATEGYGYSYADLPTIFTAITPLLKKHGLGFYQGVEGQQLKTVLFHVESGESIDFSSDIPQGVALAKMNDFQVMGSAISYLRRYAISAILGLVTEKDTDAAGEQVATRATAAADKPWLNENTPEWEKAIEFLKGDGSIPEIRRKYAVSKKSEENLKAAVL